MTKKKNFDVWVIISLTLLVLFSVFLVFPLIHLLKESVITNGEFSLEAFRRFFSKPYYYSSIFNSFKVAIASTFFSLLLGIPFAYFYSFFKLKGKKVLFILVLLSTMSAPFIGAYAWILLMGNSGLITLFLQSLGLPAFSIYGFGGIVLVQSLKLFPLVVIYMNGAFQDIDNSLLEAAESMNCKGFERFRRVIMQLSMPTILAAALLVFMRSFADFGTPALIGRGYQTFPVLIFNAFLGENGTDYHFAAAISVIAIVVTAVIFILQKITTNKFKFTINALHPVEPKQAKGFFNGLIHVFCYFLVALAMLPQLYVVNMSFRNYNNSILRPGYSLVNYKNALRKNLVRSITNTLSISFISLAIIIVIAILIAYLVVKRSNFVNNTIDVISMMPYIMPGGVIGIALILSFSGGKLAFTGTIWIMILALVIRRMPFTSRSATAALMKIPDSIEEAALSLGASKMASFFKITVPMMSSGIISGAILSWVSIITEMSSGVMLYNNRTITLTLSTYAAINNGVYGVAAVFATITTLFTVICLAVYLKVTDEDSISM